MKKTKRLWALLLAMVMALGLISTAFAAPTIDSGRKASLSLYKYDITAASAGRGVGCGVLCQHRCAGRCRYRQAGAVRHSGRGV